MSTETNEKAEQGVARTWNNNERDAVYKWPARDIRLAEEISERPIRVLWGAIKTQSRNDARSTVDNDIDMVAFMNNHQTWNAAASRMMIWVAAFLGQLAVGSIIWAAYLSAQDDGLSLAQEVARKGSVSALYRESHGASPANRLFEAFLSCASLLFLFSNFGFYILPRWDKPKKALENRRDKIGKHSYQIFRTFFVCFNYRRTEATSNWIIGEEGLFKLTWQIVTPISMLLVATIPSPPPSESSTIQAQELVHRVMAIMAFLSYFLCEMYQLIRGERIFRGFRSSTQLLRFLCMILAAIGMGIYIVLDSVVGVPRNTESTASLIQAVAEALGFVFILFDMQLISLIPIKAELSVFALGGTTGDQKQRMRVQSMYTKSVPPGDEMLLEDSSSEEMLRLRNTTKAATVDKTGSTLATNIDSKV